MFKKLMIQLALVIGLSLTIPMTACAYTIEADPINFTYFPGSASNELIVLHESGNERNLGPYSLDNEVAYMKRNWSNAYVSYFVGSGGRVKQLAPAGQIQYGAGSLANQKAYAQIELARTNNAATFKKDYAAYVGGLVKRSWHKIYKRAFLKQVRLSLFSQVNLMRQNIK